MNTQRKESAPEILADHPEEWEKGRITSLMPSFPYTYLSIGYRPLSEMGSQARWTLHMSRIARFAVPYALIWK